MILWANMMQAPDSHGWLAVAIISLVFYIITLLAFVPSLQDNELFKTLATVIVGSGFIGGVIAYFYSNSKSKANDDKK